MQRGVQSLHERRRRALRGLDERRGRPVASELRRVAETDGRVRLHVEAVAEFHLQGRARKDCSHFSSKVIDGMDRIGEGGKSLRGRCVQLPRGTKQKRPADNRFSPSRKVLPTILSIVFSCWQ